MPQWCFVYGCFDISVGNLSRSFHLHCVQHCPYLQWQACLCLVLHQYTVILMTFLDKLSVVQPIYQALEEWVNWRMRIPITPDEEVHGQDNYCWSLLLCRGTTVLILQRCMLIWSIGYLCPWTTPPMSSCLQHHFCAIGGYMCYYRPRGIVIRERTWFEPPETDALYRRFQVSNKTSLSVQQNRRLANRQCQMERIMTRYFCCVQWHVISTTNRSFW